MATLAHELAQTIVEHAFVPLANGIAADLRHRGTWASSAEQRSAIFDGARAVLFRLLFLRFAEERGLLPRDTPVYVPHSLHTLIQTQTPSRAPDNYALWERVEQLYEAAQAGCAAWGVPRCGDVIAAPALLEHIRIDTSYLTPVFAMLAHDELAHDVGLLGAIYECLLGYTLVETPEDTLVLQRSRAGKRASGAFYTPQHVVAMLVEQTVAPLLAERIARYEDNPTPTTRAALFDLALLDPAMGCGVFLLASIDFIVTRLLALKQQSSCNPFGALLGEARARLKATQASDPQLLRQIVLQRCIYGIDLDERAVEIARLSLWLECCVPGVPIDVLYSALRCGNSLIGAQLRALAYEHVPPDVAAGLRLLHASAPPFDYHTAAAYEHSVAPTRRLLDKETGRTLVSRAPRYNDDVQTVAKRYRFLHWELAFPTVFFDLERQEHKSPPQAGFDAVIGNPPYLTTLDDNERAFFATWSQTRGREWDAWYLFIEQSLQRVRPGGRCGMVVPSVWMLQHQAEPFRRHLLNHTILHICDLGFAFSSATVPVMTLVVAQHSPPIEHVITLQERDGTAHKVLQTAFSALPQAQFNLALIETLPFLRRIAAISTPLDTYAESHEGIHSGNIRHKLFTQQAHANARPLYKGANISRYATQWGGWHVQYDPTLIDRAAGEYASLRDERLFTAPTIYTRQTGDRIVATWTACGLYCDNTLHATQLRAGVDLAPLYLVALLNSRLLTFVYQQYTRERGRPLAQVKLVFLRQLPIRRIAWTTPQPERARLAATAAQQALESTEPSDLGMDQPDVLHDLLALLAARMFDLNRQKQAEQGAFLGWLAAETHSDLGRWMSKTILQTYWSQPWEHIEQMLMNNRARYLQARGLRGEAARAAMYPLLQATRTRWEQSRATLIPLQEAICATDRLIDRIVYQLYELSAQEIALVEAMGS